MFLSTLLDLELVATMQIVFHIYFRKCEILYINFFPIPTTLE